MIEILKKFNWLRAFFPTDDDSARLAKERLRLVLIQDQASISPGLMSLLRDEMIGVVSRYLEIDSSRLEMGIERKNERIALAANIPIVRIRKEGPSPEKESPAVMRDVISAEVAAGSSLAPSSSEVKGERRYRRGRKRAH